MAARVFFSLGKLESLQDLIARCDRVGKALHSWRELFEFVPAEVTVTGPGGQDQKVVRDRHVLPVAVTDDDAFLILVHSDDITEEDSGVLLVLENPPDRKTNLIGGKNRGGHLVEQRLKQVVMRPIDQSDFHRRLLERFGRSESAKATAHYNDSRLSHLLPQLSTRRKLQFREHRRSTTNCNPRAILEAAEREEKRAAIERRVFSE